MSTVAVFFYGLFMDIDLLRQRGVAAGNPQRARLDGYRLVLGSRATLVPAPGSSAHGILMHLPREDIERLYDEPSLKAYRSEEVRVKLGDGQTVSALCYNLPQPLPRSAPDRNYARQLYELAVKLGLPDDYTAAISRAGTPDDD